MWESPIQMITNDIVKNIEQKQGVWLMESVHRAGFNIDKDELMKALNYDRGQYEKGYADGRWARDSEIVRCKDCKHWMDIDNGRQKHEMCAQLVPEWYCADGERKETEDAKIY